MKRFYDIYPEPLKSQYKEFISDQNNYIKSLSVKDLRYIQNYTGIFYFTLNKFIRNNFEIKNDVFINYYIEFAHSSGNDELLLLSEELKTSIKDDKLKNTKSSETIILTEKFIKKLNVVF